MSSREIQGCQEKEEGKIEDESMLGQQESEAPPIPMIPDDIDDSDGNFPLITSVFSLASSDESPERTNSSQKELSQKVTSPEVTSPNKASSCSSPSEHGKQSSISFRSSPKSPTTTAQVNVPYYVGKGKLLLPKTDQGKTPPQTAGVTFSKMVSIQPNTSSTNNSQNKANASKINTGMLTRSALKKSDVTNTSGKVTGSGAVTSVTTSINGPMVNLATTLPFLNAKSATAQIAVPPLSTPSTITSSSSVLGNTNKLMQIVQRIGQNTTINTSIPGQTVVKSPITTPVVNQKVPLLTTMKPQKPRHVNIAPAPSNTAHFVMVPKTSTPTATSTIVTKKQVSSNIPRVVVVPKQNKAAPVSVNAGQLMYLIENKTADGKTFRFLIPTDSAKIISSPTTASKALTTPSPTAPVVTATSPAALTTAAPTTSPTQLIKIIPKPAQANLVTKELKTTATAVVSSQKVGSAMTTSSGVPVLKAGPGNPFVNKDPPVVLNTGTTTPVTGNITPPGSTSPTLNTTSMTSPITEEDSINTPPISPVPADESPSSDDAMDAGLSPHEARIQKLKELLRKQEDAVNRLREKRQKEIDDVRAPPTVTASASATTAEGNKRDSPFAVPLPPKKARYEQYKRNKLTETSTQTSKDGFLPNTDDTQFVKLVGLEKVVDKLKSKKILELSENKVSN